VGGHGDPGETDPLAIVLREAAEETGLTDLAPWPDAEIRQVVIVDVPPGKGEPAHQHADVRFFMATQTPDAIQPENEHAQLRWLTLRGARDLTSEPNLREAIDRIEPLFSPLDPGSERSALMSRGKVRGQCPAAMVSAH
jgi:8-oxo-dGTP pyrophosphatase MutT (NUDIX family)